MRMPLLSAATALLTLSLAAPAQAATCRTSTLPGVSPPTMLEICITSPAANATLTGTTTISATTAVTGSQSQAAIKRMVFSIDTSYVLTDYEPPFSFVFDSRRYADGNHTLSVAADTASGRTTPATSVAVRLANGVITPAPPPTGFAARPGTPAAPGRPSVIVAVGDHAGGEQTAADVARLVGDLAPNMVLSLGDVYEQGSPEEFENWYGREASSFLGRYQSITNPTVGNHEYLYDNLATGYLTYWSSPPTYYSFNVANWHLVQFSSMCGKAGGCDIGSPQYAFLDNDLATNSAQCTLAFTHFPRFNIGEEGEAAVIQPLWNVLAARGADLLLSGHDHNYQRWQPLNAGGIQSTGGVVQIVVGTGGHSLQSATRADSRVAVFASRYGVLRLELFPRAARFAFVTTSGEILDQGIHHCSGNGVPDLVAPATPAVTAVAASTNSSLLRWTATTDSGGSIFGYSILRNGIQIATVDAATHSYVDSGLAPKSANSYTVIATDSSGNPSAQSVPAVVDLSRLADFGGGGPNEPQVAVVVTGTGVRGRVDLLLSVRPNGTSGEWSFSLSPRPKVVRSTPSGVFATGADPVEVRTRLDRLPPGDYVASLRATTEGGKVITVALPLKVAAVRPRVVRKTRVIVTRVGLKYRLRCIPPVFSAWPAPVTARVWKRNGVVIKTARANTLMVSRGGRYACSVTARNRVGARTSVAVARIA